MSEFRSDELPPGGRLFPEVAARPSASTILLRESEAGLETLMIERLGGSSFAPGAWVFPGGAVDPEDGGIAGDFREDLTLATRKVCAVRELFEETGIWIGAPLDDAEEWRRGLLGGTRRFADLASGSRPSLDRLTWTSHWFTPVGSPKRFDTYFFLVRVPSDCEAHAEKSEAVATLWITPEAALERRERGELSMVFPTVRNLKAICGYRDAEALVASRQGVKIEPVLPVIVMSGGTARLGVPGEEAL